MPPEYQSSATKELTPRASRAKRPNRSKTPISGARANRKPRAPKPRKTKAILDQKRQDTALLETYANEKEIDLKRDRDLSVLDLQIEQLKTALKSATQRYNDVERAARPGRKGKSGRLPRLKDELTRATADKERLEKAIETKQKEKEEMRKRYAEYRSATPS